MLIGFSLCQCGQNKIHSQSKPVISHNVNPGNNLNASSSHTGFIRNNTTVLQPIQENRLNTMTPAAGGSGPSRANPFSKGVGFGIRPAGTVPTASHATGNIVAPVPSLPTNPTPQSPANTRTIFKFGGSGNSSVPSSQQNKRTSFGTSQSSSNPLHLRTEAQAPSNQPDLDTSFNADDFLDADLFDFLDEDSPLSTRSSVPNQVTPLAPQKPNNTAPAVSQNKPIVGRANRSKPQGTTSPAPQGQQQTTPIVVNTMRRPSPIPSNASSTTTIKAKIEPQEHAPPRRSSPAIPERPVRAVSIPAESAESAGSLSSWTRETFDNSGEGSRPGASDTIDIRGSPQLNIFARNIIETDRRGQVARRSKSSSSLPSEMRERRRIPGPAGNLPKLVCYDKQKMKQRSLICKLECIN